MFTNLHYVEGLTLRSAGSEFTLALGSLDALNFQLPARQPFFCQPGSLDGVPFLLGFLTIPMIFLLDLCER